MPPKSASPTLFATVSDIVDVGKRLPAAVCLFEEEDKKLYSLYAQPLARELYHALRKKYQWGGLGKVFEKQEKLGITCVDKKIVWDSLRYAPLMELACILFYGSKCARQSSNPTKALRVLRLALLSPELTSAQVVEIECFAAFIYFRGDTIQHQGAAPTLQQNLPMALHCLTRACQDFQQLGRNLTPPQTAEIFQFKLSIPEAASAEPEEQLPPERILNYLIFLLAHLEHDLEKKPKLGEAVRDFLWKDICELKKIWGSQFEFQEGEELPAPRLTLTYLLDRCQYLIHPGDEPELKDVSDLVEQLSSPKMLQTFLLDNHEGGNDYADASPQPDDGAGAGAERESSDEEVTEFTQTLSTRSMNARERAISRLEIILTYVARIVRQKLRMRETDDLQDALLQFLDFGVQLISVYPRQALGRAFATIEKLWREEIKLFVGDADLSLALKCLLDIIPFHLVECRHDLSLIQEGFHEAGQFLPRLAEFALFETNLKRQAAPDMAAKISESVPGQIKLETEAYQQCVDVAKRFFKMATEHRAQQKTYLELGLRYLLKGFSILENGIINKEMYFRIALAGDLRIEYIKRHMREAAGLFQNKFAEFAKCYEGRPPLGLSDLKLAVAQIGLPVHPLFGLFANIASQLKEEVTVYVWMEAFSTVFNLAAMDKVDQALKEFLRTEQAEEGLQKYRDSVKPIILDAYKRAREWLRDKYKSVDLIVKSLAEILEDPYHVGAYLQLDDSLQTLQTLKPEDGGLFDDQLAEARLSINLFFSLLYRWKLIDAMPARAGLRIYHARRFLTERRIKAYNPEDPETFNVARLRGLIQERKEENKFKLIPYQSVDMFVAESAVQWSQDETVLESIIASAETVHVALMRSAFALCRQVYLELALQLKKDNLFDKYKANFDGMYDLIKNESDVSAVSELPRQLSAFIVLLGDIWPTCSSLDLAERLRDKAQEEEPLWLSLSSVLKEIGASGMSPARALRYVRVACQLQACLEKRFEGLLGEWKEVIKYCETLSGELEKNIVTLSERYDFDIAQIKQSALGEFEGVSWEGMHKSTLVDQISYYKYMLESLFSTQQKELFCDPAKVCVAIFQQLGHESYGQVLAEAVKMYAQDKPMLFAIFDHIHQQCLSESRGGIEVEEAVVAEFSKLLDGECFKLLKTAAVGLDPRQKSEAAKFIFDATPGKNLPLLTRLLELQGAGTAMRINLFACEPAVGAPVCDIFYKAAVDQRELQRLWQKAGFAAGPNCLVALRKAVFALVKWYSEHEYDNPIRVVLIKQLEDYVDSQERLGEERVEDKKALRIFKEELEIEKGLQEEIAKACESIKDDDLRETVRNMLFADLSRVREKPIEYAICIALDRVISRESFEPARSWHLYCEAKRDPLIQQRAIMKWRSEPDARESVEMIFMFWIYRFSTLDSNPMLKEEWLECMGVLSMLGPALADTTAEPEGVRSDAGGGSSAGGAADDDCSGSPVWRPALKIAHHLLMLTDCLAASITEQHDASSVRPGHWVGALRSLRDAVGDMLSGDDAFAVLRLSVCCEVIQGLCVDAAQQTPADGVQYAATLI